MQPRSTEDEFAIKLHSSHMLKRCKSISVKDVNVIFTPPSCNYVSKWSVEDSLQDLSPVMMAATVTL